MDYIDNIEKAINELFESEAAGRGDELVRFIERIYNNYRAAIVTINRRTALLLFAWGAGVALGNGLVSEAAVAGLKISSITSLLPAFPLLIGFIGYDLHCAIAAQSLLWSSIECYYMKALPAAYNLKLEYLIAPPTFSNVERMYYGSSVVGKITSVSIGTIFFSVVILGPLAAIGHITYLEWALQGCSKVAICISSGIGLMFWVRSVVLFCQDWK